MSKRKISFYISLKAINFIDLSNPEKGNPGIGATEYLFVLITSQLTLKYSNLHITLMTDYICKLPSYIEVIKVDDEFDAVNRAKKLEVDLLVIRTSIDNKLYEHIENVRQKVITWSHNRIWGDTAKLIANCKYIVRNICVGARQALELVDHKLYSKTEVIFNPVIINDDFKRKLELPTVTYIGHLNKSRGFHILAKIWKDILKEVPNAQLYVIGSSSLYNRSTKLGKLGIATEQYEKKFIKYITKTNGDVLPSVHFQGIMGQEKTSVYEKTYVGVINPIGYETLGLSGLEMEACGIPLVTLNKYGQSEIVMHQHTGYLFNNIKEFREYIIMLLLDKDLNTRFGDNAKKYVDKKFNLEEILEKWKIEFEIILNNDPPKQKDMKTINKRCYDNIRILYASIKQNSIFTRLPSILEIQTIFVKLYYFIRNR